MRNIVKPLPVCLVTVRLWGSSRPGLFRHRPGRENRWTSSFFINKKSGVDSASRRTHPLFISVRI